MTKKAPEFQSKRRRLKVLIVDDSPAIRTSFSALLARLPDVDVVGAAEDGLQALQLAAELKPDVLTLDIKMPRLNGLEVLARLKADNLKPSIIMLTSFAEHEFRARCKELGAEYYFQKVTEFDQAMQVICVQAQLLNSAAGAGG